MKIKDLGALEGTVLLFGGPYSNIQATRALIDAARVRDIPAQNVICTGDVVAYGANPSETAAAVREFGCPVVAGNMEISLGQNALDCGCGFEDGTACDLMSGMWFGHANSNTNAQDRRWMSQCPDWIIFTHMGKRHVVLHGGASDVARFIWPTTSTAEFAREWALVEQAVGPVDRVIAGHSGIPFQQRFEFGDWINAGAIGMPCNDGRRQTAYATLSDTGIALHGLTYDHQGAYQAMVDAGLTQGYHTALQTGYWPSEDILPLELRSSARASG